MEENKKTKKQNKYKELKALEEKIKFKNKKIKQQLFEELGKGQVSLKDCVDTINLEFSFYSSKELDEEE